MDPLTVLSTCSLAKDFTLVLAMMLTFSRGEPYTVRSALDAVEVVPLRDPAVAGENGERTVEAALAEMHRIKEPFVGLLPVPVAWASLYEFQPKDLLDPCINVSVATAQLAEHEHRCGRRARARECALRAYAEAARMPLLEVAVLDTIREQHLPTSAKAVVVETDAILGSEVFVYPEVGARGIDQIFVERDAPHTREDMSTKNRSRKKPNTKEVPQHDTNNPTTLDTMVDRRGQLTAGLSR